MVSKEDQHLTNGAFYGKLIFGFLQTFASGASNIDAKNQLRCLERRY